MRRRASSVLTICRLCQRVLQVKMKITRFPVTSMLPERYSSAFKINPWSMQIFFLSLQAILFLSCFVLQLTDKDKRFICMHYEMVDQWRNKINKHVCWIHHFKKFWYHLSSWHKNGKLLIVCVNSVTLCFSLDGMRRFGFYEYCYA